MSGVQGFISEYFPETQVIWGHYLFFGTQVMGALNPNHPEGYVPVPEDHVTFINYFTLTTSMNSTTSQHLKINN